MSSPLTLPLYSSQLAWGDSTIPGAQETFVSAIYDVFAVAQYLRQQDPSAAYAVLDRDGCWFVVAMPDDPPSQKSDTKSGPVSSRPVSAWQSRFTVSGIYAPWLVAEFILYGPTQKYLELVGRRLGLIAPKVLHVVRGSAVPVDFGCDYDPADVSNSLHPSWVDDGSNQITMIEAIGGIIKYLRTTDPRDVPDNTELAKELAKVFAKESAVPRG